MSVSLNGDTGCWSELLDLLLSLWSFSFCLFNIFGIYLNLNGSGNRQFFKSQVFQIPFSDDVLIIKV